MSALGQKWTYGQGAFDVRLVPDNRSSRPRCRLAESRVFRPICLCSASAGPLSQVWPPGGVPNPPPGAASLQVHTVWMRIMEAIEALQRERPRDGEAMH